MNLENQILGVIYGNCLGDAVGLATEFLDSEMIKKDFPESVNNSNFIIPFPTTKLNSHNERWQLGDWTDDSDQMILILQSILANNKSSSQFLQVNPVDFGKRLKHWASNGFSELGDKGGMGIGFTVLSVIRHPKFDQDPITAAEEIWTKHGKNLAANGALMRTSILGVVNFSNLNQVIDNTKLICKVTHADSRCIASCIVICSLIAMILQKKHFSNHQFDISALLQDAYQLALKELDSSHKTEFDTYFHYTNVKDMKLDDSHGIGYTLKCMACGLYGLRNYAKPFEQVITDIVIQGGDSDTNGTVCGALWGVINGFDKFPKKWIQSMPHKVWLDKQVISFVELLGLSKETASSLLQG